MKTFFTARSGFTILEVLIASFITVLVIGTATVILVTGQRMVRYTTTVLDQQYQAQ